MRVKLIIKKEENKDNNKVLSSNKEMTMMEARLMAKAYNKENVLWIKAKWFGEWHYCYRTLWKRGE